MLSLCVLMKVKSPLCIKMNNDMGVNIKSMDYIPGSVLRGEFARIYFKHFEKTGLEKTMFFSDKVRFSNLYVSEKGLERYLPIPFSIHSCKYYPGVGSEKAGDGVHGIKSLLLDDSDWKCNVCDSKLEEFSDLYYLNRNMELLKPKKNMTGKVSSDNVFEKSMDERLYFNEYICEEQNFIGKIDIEGKESDKIAEKIREIGNFETYIGTGKSRGMGNVDISIFEYENNEKKFDIGKTKEKVNGKYVFTLDFTSDCILLDDFMVPIMKPDIDTLIRYLDWDENTEKNEIDELKKFKLNEKNMFLKKCVISGWNSQANLPKSKDLAVLKGSVFEYFTKEDFDSEVIEKVLTRLSRKGIGERINEGYGQIHINNDWHFRKQWR